MPPPVLRVSVIGTCTISLGRTRVRPDATVFFALLLYLALRAGSRVTRAELLEIFWSDTPEAAHRHALRQLLYRVRRAGLEFDEDGSAFRVEPASVACDVGVLNGPDWDTTVALADIPAPSAILRSYQPQITPAFAEWIDSIRAAAASRIRAAALRHVARGRREGRWVDVETAARLCLATDSLNEEATLALSEATVMGGSKAEALRLLDAYLWELGDREKTIGLPAKLLRRRISDQPAFRTQPTGEPALIARADDLSWLNGQLDVAAGGVSHTALIAGPPGIGKSAVARSFMAHAEMRGWRLGVSRLQPSDVDRPMSVFVELLPALLKAEGSLGAAPESIAQLRRLVEHRTEDDILANKSQEAEAVQYRIRTSCLDLIAAVAHEGPILLLLEDLHWIDAQSLRLLAWLHEHATSVPVLWLLTARMESRFAALRDALPADRVPSRVIEPLGAAEAAALFKAFAPTVPSDAPVTQLAYQVTGGNPLFLREVAGHWLDTGGDERLPSNLRALIRGRVARLAPSTQKVLHCCAVLGHFATVQRVSAVLGASTGELLDAINELGGLGLVGLTGEPDSLALHDLWQEELVSTLRPAARSLLHLRSGEVLAAESEENRSASTVSEAARHLVGAGATDRALALLDGAAQHQLANGFTDDAVLTSRLAFATSANTLHVEKFRALHLRALHQAGSWADIVKVGVSDATQGVAATQLGRHSAEELWRLEGLWRTKTQARAAVSGALQCAEDGRAPTSHRLHACLLAAQAAANLFDSDAMSRARLVLAELPRVTQDDACTGLTADLVLETEVGSLETATRCATKLIELELSRSSAASLSRAYRFASYPFRAIGKNTQAMHFSTTAFETAVRFQNFEQAAQAADVAGTLSLEYGRVDDSLTWIAIAESWARRVSLSYLRRSLTLLRAAVALRTGQVDQASGLLEHLSRDAESTITIREQLWILSLRSQILVLTRELDGLAAVAGELEQLLTQARTFVQQDRFVCAFVTAMRMLNRCDEAKEYAKRYRTTWRRDRTPIPQELTADA